MLIIIDGKDYDWRGEYREPKQGDIILGHGEGSIVYLKNAPHSPWGIRAIIHPVPVTYTFGGIVFEKIDFRTPVKGEWFLFGDTPRGQDGSWMSSYQILKPVEVGNA